MCVILEGAELKIDAKISANGVGSFTTAIIDRDAVEEGEFVRATTAQGRLYSSAASPNVMKATVL